MEGATYSGRAVEERLADDAQEKKPQEDQPGCRCVFGCLCVQGERKNEKRNQKANIHRLGVGGCLYVCVFRTRGGKEKRNQKASIYRAATYDYK